MAYVQLKNICKKYEKAPRNSVTDFNLDIEEGEFIAFVGPSGCGKSTTLRMIAGFESITSGELFIGGKLMNQVQPMDRGISMVFQNYALYPHMNVEKNISYGLKNMKVPADEIKRKSTGPSKFWVWKNTATGSRRIFPAASGRESLWAAPSSRIRNCSSWTSPCPIWTPSCASACGRRSASFTGRFIPPLSM